MGTQTALVIEGGLVSKRVVETGKNHDGSEFRRETTHQPVQLIDWLTEVVAQIGLIEFFPTLKHGQILARKAKDDRSVVVVQLPPAVRSFYYSPDNRLYRVAMPWVVVIIQFVGGAVNGASSRNRCGVFWFYRNEPIMSLDDELGFCNMPNTYSDGALCWGGGTVRLSDPLYLKVEAILESLFASHFNKHELNDSWYPATQKVESHPQSFEEWETRSAEDPAFVLKLKWRPTGKTVRQVMEEWVK